MNPEVVGGWTNDYFLDMQEYMLIHYSLQKSGDENG